MAGAWRGRLLAALAVAGVVLAGCSGGEEPPGTVNVAMYDNFFARDVTRVPLGTRVRFPNKGRAVHNAVAADGSWRTPVQVPADQAAAVVVDHPGVYRFYCSFHATEDVVSAHQAHRLDLGGSGVLGLLDSDGPADR